MIAPPLLPLAVAAPRIKFSYELKFLLNSEIRTFGLNSNPFLKFEPLKVPPIDSSLWLPPLRLLPPPQIRTLLYACRCRRRCFPSPVALLIDGQLNERQLFERKWGDSGN